MLGQREGYSSPIRAAFDDDMAVSSEGVGFKERVCSAGVRKDGGFGIEGDYQRRAVGVAEGDLSIGGRQGICANLINVSLLESPASS